MTISDVAIRRPVFTTMMGLALVVLGVMGAQRISTELWPSVTIPFCTVTTVFPGASPQDIETQVTRPLEDAISGIAGIDRLFSQTRENFSMVFVQFKIGMPLSEAVQQVRDKVGASRGMLPRSIDAPVVAQFDISAQPVVVLTASSNEDLTDLHDLVDDQVRPRLEQVQGVAAAKVVGGNPREISVEVIPERLAMTPFPLDVIFQRIRGENVSVPAGHYPTGSTQVGVRVLGEFSDIGSLRDMVVAADATREAHLSDLAKVREQPAEAQTIVRTGGRPALAVEVIKQPGANSVAVAKAVRAELKALEAQLGERLHTDVIIDQSADIEANAHEVWNAIYFGGAMAVLIILFFLLDWRGTLISALALPTSVVGTLFVMWLLNFSFNTITLIAISLAIGLLIDDAVVVREAITRRLERGDNPMSAASAGTQEIALAVMATTFTLCAVFFPVGFMQGVVAQFFRQFGLTLAVAVLISLLVAFTLDPMLSARFVRPHSEAPRTGLPRLIERFLQGLDSAYGSSLRWVLQWPKTTFLAALAVFAGSLWLATQLGTEFIPPQDRAMLTVALEFPPGTRLDVSSERSAAAEAEVLKLPGMRTVYSVVGPDGEMEKVRWRVLLKDKSEREQGMEFYKTKLREIIAAIPQGRGVVSEPPMLEGVGDWPPVWVQVVGPDFDVLSTEAEFVAQTLRDLPGTTDVKLLDNPGKPELAIAVDREKAAKLNMPAGAIAMQVRMATQGEIAGKLRQGRKQMDIRVRLAEKGRNTPEALAKLRIISPQGKAVDLSEVTSQVKSVGPSVIERESRERQVSIMAQLSAGHDLGSVNAAMRDKLAQHKLPEGYQYMFKGQMKDMGDMLDSTKVALGLALIFIYIVLASQFESLIHPVTIMVALPLALIGCILGLAASMHPLSIGAAIGIILLMGLVTKNAILLVDGALVHVRAGDGPRAAMHKAGPRRLRPILMTSGAMVLGMLPTAMGRGTGSEFRSPMAIGVIGGVLTSTLLTLWVVPVVFVWLERLRGHHEKDEQPQGHTESKTARRLATSTLAESE